MRAALLALFLLASCSPHSLEDFHHEGESQTRVLIKDLRQIQTREELQKALPLLKNRFDSLVALIIEARKYQDRHPGEDYEQPDSLIDEELLAEMQRLYRLEDGRELIEKAQREALLRLDAFERTLAKQRSRVK